MERLTSYERPSLPIHIDRIVVRNLMLTNGIKHECMNCGEISASYGFPLCDLCYDGMHMVMKCKICKVRETTYSNICRLCSERKRPKTGCRSCGIFPASGLSPMAIHWGDHKVYIPFHGSAHHCIFCMDRM
jgi:hypothetical protein